MTKTLVIMPTYNEALNIVDSINSLFQHNEVDLLVVDDNSPDATAQIAKQQASKRPGKIFVLERSNKEGLGRAYLDAFNWAFSHGYDRVVEMDADGSHRSIDLPKLLQVDADLVIGSRWVAGGAVANWPAYRKAISRIGNRYAKLMLGTKVNDMTAGFRVYRTDFLKRLELDSIAAHGYAFQVEMTWRSIKAGGSVAEVPITFVERELGVSKMNTAIVIEALWLVTKWGVARILKL